MNNSIFFTILLLSVYFLTNYLIVKKKKDLTAFSGLEFLIPGIIFNPAFCKFVNYIFNLHLIPIIPHNLMINIDPFIYLAIGFTGLSYGLKFNIKEIFGYDAAIWKYSILHFSGIFLLSGVYLLFISQSLNISSNLGFSLILICLITPPSLQIIKIYFKKNLANPFYLSLKKIILIQLLISVIVWGSAFYFLSFNNNSSFSVDMELRLLIINFLLILILLFILFSHKDNNNIKLFTILAAIVLIVSGICYNLHFSLIFTSFLAGILIKNLFNIQYNFSRAVDDYLHPITILLIFSSAYYWIPSEFSDYLFILIVIPLFFLSKFIFYRVNYYSSTCSNIFKKDIGKSLLSIDSIIFAFLAEYRIFYYEMNFSFVINFALISILINNIFFYKYSRNYLIDIGEIKEL